MFCENPKQKLETIWLHYDLRDYLFMMKWKNNSLSPLHYVMMLLQMTLYYFHLSYYSNTLMNTNSRWSVVTDLNVSF